MLYYHNIEGNARIAVWHVTESYEELLELLPDADSVSGEAESKFSSESRRLEWTAVRVLLCNMLERQVLIEYNELGAPLLPEYERLNISISHTHGYVAVALSERNAVGIDIEQIERTEEEKESKVERVKGKFMGEREHADTTVGLLLHWSAKETAFKVLGETGIDFKKDFCIEPFDELDMEGEFNLRDMDGHIHRISYKVFDDFVLTFTNYEK